MNSATDLASWVTPQYSLPSVLPSGRLKPVPTGSMKTMSVTSSRLSGLSRIGKGGAAVVARVGRDRHPLRPEGAHVQPQRARAGAAVEQEGDRPVRVARLLHVGDREEARLGRAVRGLEIGLARRSRCRRTRWPPKVPVWRVTETIGSGIGLSAVLAAGRRPPGRRRERRRRGARRRAGSSSWRRAIARAPAESKRLPRAGRGCDLPAMRLRVATPEDEEAVASVLGPSYTLLMAAAYPPDLLARTLPSITRANPALLSSGRYYLVEAETGEPAGCGGWSPDPPGRKDEDRRARPYPPLRHPPRLDPARSRPPPLRALRRRRPSRRLHPVRSLGEPERRRLLRLARLPAARADRDADARRSAVPGDPDGAGDLKLCLPAAKRSGRGTMRSVVEGYRPGGRRFIERTRSFRAKYPSTTLHVVPLPV